MSRAVAPRQKNASNARLARPAPLASAGGPVLFLPQGFRPTKAYSVHRPDWPVMSLTGASAVQKERLKRSVGTERLNGADGSYVLTAQMARPAPRSWAGGPVAPLASAGGPVLFLPQGFRPTEALDKHKGRKGGRRPPRGRRRGKGAESPCPRLQSGRS